MQDKDHLFINQLNQIPLEVHQTTDFIVKLDECFLHGFKGLDDNRLSTIESLTRVFNNTPLQEQVQLCYDQIRGRSKISSLRI